MRPKQAATGTKGYPVATYNSRRRRRIAAVILLAAVSAVAAGLAAASPARADYAYPHVVFGTTFGTNAIGGDALEAMPIRGENL
jgi:hypothetical protein